MKKSHTFARAIMLLLILVSTSEAGATYYHYNIPNVLVSAGPDGAMPQSIQITFKGFDAEDKNTPHTISYTFTPDNSSNFGDMSFYNPFADHDNWTTTYYSINATDIGLYPTVDGQKQTKFENVGGDGWSTYYLWDEKDNLTVKVTYDDTHVYEQTITAAVCPNSIISPSTEDNISLGADYFTFNGSGLDHSVGKTFLVGDETTIALGHTKAYTYDQEVTTFNILHIRTINPLDDDTDIQVADYDVVEDGAWQSIKDAVSTEGGYTYYAYSFPDGEDYPVQVRLVSKSSTDPDAITIADIPSIPQPPIRSVIRCQDIVRHSDFLTKGRCC